MSDREHGPLPTWLTPVARAAAVAYGAAVWVNERRLQGGAPHRVGVPVVSVGNVTAGGTGKTPFVRWCAQQLVADGHHPVIALRGYRSRGGDSDEAL
ncbi:MAG: tetraacyldisaccharide 4'-kinase, partial [Phycisphaerae bacterium]|nr:tetraacyldisaccharide 4'-kinase [Phycisphaerae bacterium]